MSRKNESNWVRKFEVTNPTRHKRGFTVYKVISKVFPKTFPEGVSTITVWKRYNDFKKLYKELQKIHKDLHLRGEFPKFPTAKAFGFGRFDYDIVEERQKAAYALLDFAANHSQLFTSKVFVQFFENGYHVKETSVPTTGDVVDSGVSNHGDCLVPERVWMEKDTQLLAVHEDDAVSISSVGSSTAFTDSDSMISSSLLSGACETPSLMHPSNTVDFGSLSFQSSGVAKSPTDSSDLRAEASERSCGSHQRSKARLGIGDRDSSIGESYTASISSISTSHSSLPLASNSKSLPSLDAISSNSGAGHSQCSEILKVKRRNFKPSWSLSLRKKPSNGFAGFFDFLPIFPKMVEPKKVSDDKLFSDSLTSSYICEAAGHFAVAQQNESNGELPTALESYKEGIRILLVGGQNDKDHKRRLIVRNKVEKYLSKAEQLHSSLSGETSANVVLFSPKKIQSLLQPDSMQDSLQASKEIMKASSLEDLKSYKVVGVASKGILIVVDVEEKSGPKCYCVKVLQKSSMPLNPKRNTLIASKVPFMVKLIKWFDSENTIILLMQYAGGGKLEDFVSTYQSKPIAIIPHDTSPCLDESISDTVEGRASLSDERSLREDENAEETTTKRSALAFPTFAEQLENNSFAPNPDKEELCESYARLFQESDTEDSPCQVRDGESYFNRTDRHKESLPHRLKSEEPGESISGIRNQGGYRNEGTEERETINNPGSSTASLELLNEKLGKLSVDSSSTRGITEGTNEALESKDKVKTTSTTTQNQNGKYHGKALNVLKSSPDKLTSLFPNKDSNISWTNLDSMDTGDLIESSKVLIQTVSRTLTQCEGFPENGVDSKDKSAMRAGDESERKGNSGKHPPSTTTTSAFNEEFHLAGNPIEAPQLQVNSTTAGENGPCGEPWNKGTLSQSSLSLSGREQKLGTNEWENNNNKEQRQLQQQQQSWSQTGLVGAMRSDDDNAYTDELLTLEISQGPVLDEDEGSSATNTPSHYCRQASSLSNHNGGTDSTETLSPESQPIQRMVPECCVKVWMAEIVLALEKLHELGLTYGDLGMRNILLGENGHILLSFTSQWAEVDHIPKRSDWIAPEARSYLEDYEEKIHFSADWWSLGAILFYLLTGKAVLSCHPEGFHANTVLKMLDKNLMDEDISQHAKSLMTELLQINPSLRLGYYGAEEIKSHPFFDGFDWDNALKEAMKN